jgi:O-antigen/teichoic acid export membrane protein
MTVDTLGLRVRVAQPLRKALTNDFVRHSALVFGATMAGNVLNYLFNFALSRRLGVEGFAILSSLVSFVMVLSIPASILTLVIVKYAAVFHAAGDAQRIRRLSQILLKWSGIAACGGFAVGLLLRNQIAEFLRISDSIPIVLCLGVVSLSLVTPSVRAILQGEQDFVRYSISTVLEVFLKVAIAVALVYSGFGVTGAMGGWIIGTACALFYTAWAVLRKHGAAADATVRLSLDSRRLVQTTTGVGLASAFLILISFMDVLLVKHYFQPHDAGLYAAVNLTGKVVLFLAGFVPAVLLPKAVAKSSRGENAIPLLFQALGVTILLSGAALAFFGVLPGLVVRILAGRDFISAAPYVLQYDAAMCLLAIATLLVNYNIGIHRFSFLYALGAVVAGEIVAIALFHRSLWDVVHILLVGNAVAIAGCCVGLKPAKQTAVSEPALEPVL